MLDDGVLLLPPAAVVDVVVLVEVFVTVVVVPESDRSTLGDGREVAGVLRARVVGRFVTAASVEPDRDGDLLTPPVAAAPAAEPPPPPPAAALVLELLASSLRPAALGEEEEEEEAVDRVVGPLLVLRVVPGAGAGACRARWCSTRVLRAAGRRVREVATVGAGVVLFAPPSAFSRSPPTPPAPPARVVVTVDGVGEDVPPPSPPPPPLVSRSLEVSRLVLLPRSAPEALPVLVRPREDPATPVLLPRILSRSGSDMPMAASSAITVSATVCEAGLGILSRVADGAEAAPPLLVRVVAERVPGLDELAVVVVVIGVVVDGALTEPAPPFEGADFASLLGEPWDDEADAVGELSTEAGRGRGEYSPGWSPVASRSCITLRRFSEPSRLRLG